jgi:hypothetical protein
MVETAGLVKVALWLLAAAAPQQATYRLPYEEHKTYPVTQGNKGSTSHMGYCEYAWDFGMAEGTKVCAARGGKVVDAREDLVRGGTGGGNQIKIDHGDGTFGLYFHLKHEGALVEVGDLVLQGDVIGLSGATGNVTGPHLHFQVDKGGKSIPVAFEDVEADAGVPLSGKSYVSKNTPGIPAETKDRLSALFRARKLAEQEGAWGLVWLVSRRIADEKLKVKYPPQDEARKAAEAVPGKAEEAAQSKDPAELFRARAAFDGAPAAPIAAALEAFKDAPGYAEGKAAFWYWERYYKGLKDEIEGRLPSARTQYRNILSNKPDDALRARTQARLEAVEVRLKELLARKPAPR